MSMAAASHMAEREGQKTTYGIQGRPVIAQAGGSDAGLGFAGRHAELIFAVRHSTRGMLKVLWGILPIVAPV